MARRSRNRNTTPVPTRRDLRMQAQPARRSVVQGKRTRATRAKVDAQYVPPEDWYEPRGDLTADYRTVLQTPGPGYTHVVSAAEVRQRLSRLPTEFLHSLEVVQFSRMTRKKQSFPCYGMQWGSTIYLYPIEESLIEHFSRPPRPAVYNEARMYGGKWVQRGSSWQLVWSRDTIRDFYLNNVLIHELGHLLDLRNRSYQDRERYAEWFAIEHGYRPSRNVRNRRGVAG